LEVLTDAARDLLREPPERILLRPTRRSRLRYKTKI
jgi:hypothetical protein